MVRCGRDRQVGQRSARSVPERYRRLGGARFGKVRYGRVRQVRRGKVTYGVVGQVRRDEEWFVPLWCG